MTEPTDADLLAELDRVSHIADAGQRRLACLRAVLAKWGNPAPVGVEPAFYTVFAKFEGAPIPLAQYSASSETGVLERVMDVARKEGYTGHPQDRMTELGWVVGPVYAAPQSLAMGQVPPNWPTNEMIEAGRKAAISHGPLLGGGQSLWHVFRDMLAASPTPPAQAADSVLEDADPIRALIAEHAAILDQNESAYFELCYHRATGWMAWITDKPLCMPPVVNPDRKVLAQGQGDTADEACRDAARKQGGAT